MPRPPRPSGPPHSNRPSHPSSRPHGNPNKPQRSGQRPPRGGERGHDRSDGPSQDRPEDASATAAAPAHRGDTKFLSRGIRLVYEDDDIIVIDKPTGIITADPAVSSGGRPSARAGNTVFDVLKVHAKNSKPRRSRRDEHGDRVSVRGQQVWVIHRLDKEASGLLVFAKSTKAFAWLKEDFRAKRVHRIYSAVAEGIVGKVGDEATIQSFLVDDTPGRAPESPHKDAKRPPRLQQQEKLAVTHYRVVATSSNRTLLDLKLETGRKNQIRIHLSEKGHPLVGDRKFGSRADTIGRLALHAAELGFTHPATGQPMRFTSAPPAAFFRCVDALHLAPQPTAAEAAAANLGTTPGAPAPHAKQSSAAPSASTLPPAPGTEKTSWNEVAEWYDELLEDRRNDHYEDIIVPGALRLLEPQKGQRILDVACGQGILCRRLAQLGTTTVGVEASSRLVNAAEKRNTDVRAGAGGGANITLPIYHIADARELAALNLRDFDAAACIMALSNIDPLTPVFNGIAEALKPGGVFIWIITHPAFRAPGQTEWGWDAKQNRQYRRIDGYLSPGQKRIEMNPGKQSKGAAAIATWTFHRPLQTYIEALGRAGLLVEKLEEWPSQRASTSGPRAVEENRTRREIPLFLGVRCVKVR